MIEESLWKKTLLLPSGSIEDAIKVLSDTSLRIVLISDSDLKLMGTVTDGDIRRGLLRGLTITNPILDVINQNPIVVSENLPRDQILKIMSNKKIFQIPIVGMDKKLVGLHLWEELSAPTLRDNLMVIMAGGKGTRLLPKTSKTPKPMLQLGGKPILEHIIEGAKEEGFFEFILSIHHLGEVIEEYFRDGEALGVKISYIREKLPLGTAGALSLLDPKPTKPIIVTNGDVLTSIRYGNIVDFHIQNDAVATMAVQAYESQISFGVVQTHGINITSYEEKPIIRSLINAGIYVLDPDALNFLVKSKSCDMPTFFDVLRKENLMTIAFPLHEKWVDLGSPSNFAQAVDEFNSTKTWNGKPSD